MLPLDIWQFCVIDYLEHNDQFELIKFIDKLELTDLIGMKELTDIKLKEYRYVKRLNTIDTKITDDGIKHLFLSLLYKNSDITYGGLIHMTNVIILLDNRTPSIYENNDSVRRKMTILPFS
jgi:hypothetical protein